MKMIPCKLCPACGKYSSINVAQCPCGADLTAQFGVAMDYNRISPDKYGRIDGNLPYYVRKCPLCSTEHFFTEATGSVRTCHNCRRVMIASQPTVPYAPEEEKKAAPAEASEESAIPAPPEISPAVTGSTSAPSPFGEIRKNVADTISPDADDEDDGGWGGLILGGPTEPRTSPNPAPPKNAPVPAPKPEPRPAAPAGVTVLTATAIRYGNLSFSLRSDSTKLPYLLGRSANHGDFLQQDPRVGNEHCYLAFRGGNWMVIERLARNGTAVNGYFLAEGGSQVLRDGDELMLGHNSDSMAFRISIR